MNITSKVNRDDKENARIDRARATNPAEVEPGMDDFDWDDEDSFGVGGDTNGGWGSSLNGGSEESGGPFGQSGGMGGPFGNPGGFGGSPSPFGGGSGFGSFGQPPQEQKKDEDKFFEAIAKAGKGFVTFSGEFVRSLKTFDVVARMSMGKASLITGGIFAVIGLILILLGFKDQLGLALLVGGLISLGSGVVLFMFSYDDFVKNGAPEPQSEPEPQQFEDAFGVSDEDSFGAFEDGFGDEEDEFNMFGDDDEDDDFEAFEDEEIDFSAFEEAETSSEEIEQNMGNALANLQDNNGMITRQYLYENIINCLMNVNQNYNGVRYIHEDTDEFDAWDAIVQNSAGVFKPKGNEIEMPYVISAKEKIFYILLEVKRVNWLKNIDNFVNEIVNIVRFDTDTGKTDTTIYGIGNTVGDKIYVKIMKGETAMVTIKDTYKEVEKEVKDNGNYMPIILGLDPEGNVVWKDFKDINSILVTGMPRSGKTWFVQSVLTQMMFFLKPSELQFHILDPKDQISDFRAMQVPHIRKFVSDDDSIIRELRNIVKVEGPRRKKIIGDAGYVNIWDYKKHNPDVDMPLLYVVIDEVITLAERMDKDTKDEFQALLLELVSQLPALGIRIFMIPHVVKDQILKKSITDLIPCRISVRGDAEHIEKSVGAKHFKHKLHHQGDMAVRFNNDDPIFVHSVVLTNSNEGNQEFFDFLLKFWTKLEPESLEGSIYDMNQKTKSKNTSGQSNVKLETQSKGNSTRGSSRPNILSDSDIDELVNKARVKDEEDIDLWR